MLRLLHTADWHLGRRFPSFPEEGQKKLSRARMDVVSRILDVARRNAVNAVEIPGGTVDVRARRIYRAGAPGVAIAMEDNGPGIPADVLPDIFDAFVTTRLDARGTGLGLTVAEGIITQHGGTITAANRREGGACLEVWLPAPH